MNNGNNIKALRETLGLSQEELGEKVGVGRSTISSWERAKTAPKRKHAGNLQAIFDGCPPPAKKKKTRYNAEEEAVKRIAKNIQAISRSFIEGEYYIITDNQELQNPILRYERKEGIHHVFSEIHGKWIVIEYSCYGVPDFVLVNIDSILSACSSAGLTFRQLAELSNVDMDIIVKYRRHEKWPCRSRYNRLAKILGWRKWKKERD